MLRKKIALFAVFASCLFAEVADAQVGVYMGFGGSPYYNYYPYYYNYPAWYAYNYPYYYAQPTWGFRPTRLHGCKNYCKRRCDNRRRCR